MAGAYQIPAASCSAEQTIKRSRFIALIAHTPDRAAAQDFIREVKMQHPQARHVCWAHIAGAPSDTQVLGFSDDGEPSGTAGKPLLAVLQGSGLGQLCVAVVRYSGGIKLGTGGLVRAYGGTAQLAVAEMNCRWFEPKLNAQLHCNYAQLERITQQIHQLDGEVYQTHYDQAVAVELGIPAAQLEPLALFLRDFSQGQITLTTDRDC